ITRGLRRKLSLPSRSDWPRLRSFARRARLRKRDLRRPFLIVSDRYRQSLSTIQLQCQPFLQRIELVLPLGLQTNLRSIRTGILRSTMPHSGILRSLPPECTWLGYLPPAPASSFARRQARDR